MKKKEKKCVSGSQMKFSMKIIVPSEKQRNKQTKYINQQQLTLKDAPAIFKGNKGKRSGFDFVYFK